MNNIARIKKSFSEKIILFFENIIDSFAINKTNFKRGKDFEAVAKKLRI
ncbi:hypothetical protein KKB64_03790 [Patescibacteria group bacterium]|nr:hypothetical protein [Patescibacteria group bacterium]MBU1472879.1 hypothetical protein [Patescibacteria group bacterium]MBU2460059.1 hypothetical protein [Patescibacteria group bacterium]MBU2544755.1 hypothetical protein [Patescibacteria group bacterium]